MPYDRDITLKRDEYEEVQSTSKGKSIPIRYKPHPIYEDLILGVAEPGATIFDSLKGMPDLEDRFFEVGIVRLNGDEIPVEFWHYVRVKPYDDARPVVMTLHMDPAGGLGKKVKSVVAIVAAISLAAATGFIGAGGLATLFPTLFSASAFGAGTLGAALAAAAVGAAGALALSALTPSPISADNGPDSAVTKAEAYARGNLLEPGGSVPRAIGTRKMFPPLACQPLVELFDGGDTIAEAIFMLAGPHNLDEPKVDEVPIEDLQGFEYETRQGFEDDAPLQLISRYGFTRQINKETVRHKMLQVIASNFLAHTPDVNACALDVSQWTSMRTKKDPDEFWIQLAMPEGLAFVTTPATAQVMFFAVRMKAEGSSVWQYLPLLHMKDAKAQQMKKQIKLIWAETAPATSLHPTTSNGWHRVWQYWPPSTGNYGGSNAVGESVYPWIADPSFASSPASSGTATVAANQRIRTSESLVEIYLDPAAFPRDKRWTVQIRRSSSCHESVMDYTNGEYQGGSQVDDQFRAFLNTGNVRIQFAQDDRLNKVFVVNTASVFNRPPINRAGVSLMAIKAKNQGVDNFSVLASGLVKDWNGAEWGGYVATSNPAPHFRDVACGLLNADPLETDLVDQSNLVDWRQWCIDYDRTVDMIADGRSVLETLATIASCGRGRVRMSDLWGVFYDRSRAGETPTQIFSPRNSNNFAFQKAFERRPHAFRVGFRDASDDYEENELYVAAPDKTLEDATRFEAISIEGIVAEQKVLDRVFYDHLQLYYRDTIFSLDVDFAGLVCRMGDLIGVNHDAMVLQHGHARVKAITLNAGNVASITLDDEVVVEDASVDLFADLNVFTIPDFFAVNVQTGIALSLTDSGGSVITKTVSNAPGPTKILTFSPTFAPPTGLEPGIYVVVGRTKRIYDEFILITVQPIADLNATLILSPYNTYMYGDEIGVPWAPDDEYWSDNTGWSW